MKRFLLLMIAVSMIPTCAKAALTADDELKVGDNVSVNLDGKHSNRGVGAFVLEDSGKGKDTVTILVERMVTNVSYPSTEQELSGNLTNNFDQSRVKDMLLKLVSNELPNGYTFSDTTDRWQHESGSERLLREADLTRLGIAKNSSGEYLITGAHAFLVPVPDGVIASSNTYWTQITEGSNKVYVVEKVGNITAANPNEIVAKVHPVDVTSSITNGPTSSIRAVVTVKKSLILCNNSATTTPTTTTGGIPNPTTTTTTATNGVPNPTTTKPSNPDTGVSNVIIPLVGLLIGTVSVAYITTKRNKFDQI